LEFEFLFPCSQETAVRSYTEPDTYSHMLVLYIRKIYFNITLSLPRSVFSYVTFLDSITLRTFSHFYMKLIGSVFDIT
jgi:hypothetical protein